MEEKKIKVYRLEDKNGNGPFSTKNDIMSRGKDGITFHRDPEDLFDMMGYRQSLLRTLYKKNFVFAWANKDSYKRFFSRGGEKICKRYHLRQNIYRPSVYLLLPDNQVMFSKPGNLFKNEEEHLKALINIHINTKDSKDILEIREKYFKKLKR